jgi:two-component system, OmpR family, sensor histidine kinase KdpD
LVLAMLSGLAWLVYRDQAFLPFRRLGIPGQTVGVGLGLAVSRSLAEAMGGTLRPEEIPCGGLTMALSLPAAPAV